MNLAEAKVGMLDLVRELSAYTLMNMAVGPLGRGIEPITTIELVAQPVLVQAAQQDMFGGKPTIQYINLLLGHLDMMLLRKRLTRTQPWRTDGMRRDFTWQKRPYTLHLLYPSQDAGVALTLLMGPEHWSKKFATRRAAGGYLPDDCQLDRYKLLCNGERVPCATEQDFFAYCDVPYIAAEGRK